MQDVSKMYQRLEKGYCRKASLSSVPLELGLHLVKAEEKNDLFRNRKFIIIQLDKAMPVTLHVSTATVAKFVISHLH